MNCLDGDTTFIRTNMGKDCSIVDSEATSVNRTKSLLSCSSYLVGGEMWDTHKYLVHRMSGTDKHCGNNQGEGNRVLERNYRWGYYFL